MQRHREMGFRRREIETQYRNETKKDLSSDENDKDSKKHNVNMYSGMIFWSCDNVGNVYVRLLLQLLL